MVEQGGLAGAQKAGEDDDRDLLRTGLAQRTTSFTPMRTPARGPAPVRARLTRRHAYGNACRPRIRAGGTTRSERWLTALAVVLSLSDPAYQVCWEPPNTRMTQERWRQLLVANLIVSMWSSDYKLGFLDDRTTRAVLSDYFRGEIGRAYWHNSGPSWHRYFDEGRDARQRRFVDLAEEAYAAAVAAGPPILTRDYFDPPAAPSAP
ncbi:DUF6082 family protein [Streptomyces sp. NPDC048415]|uniref:DUF6082 family protein n=1 Tax=Streptomyces sp. NPDC048415 TaxID=3154822 RepID=UPI0034290A4A